MHSSTRKEQVKAAALLAWYDANRRALPWRRDTDPYRVWVSEIMLQQTRVEAARGYYERFMQRFPNVEALALADLEEVFKCWEGLGYYSRARRLREAAERIAREGFPRDYAGWRDLPGIGAYTAGAVASICLGERVPAIDGNVLRVMARVLCWREVISVPSARREVEAAVDALLPAERPGDFNQALMELGAVLCTPRSPRCLLCPWREDCAGFAEGLAEELPVKAAKRAKAEEELAVAVLLREGKTLVRQRPATGILAGWWEFPHGLSTPQKGRLGLRKLTDLPGDRHVFTHKVWHMRGTLYRAGNDFLPDEKYRWVDAEELLALPIPSAMAHWRRLALEALVHP